MAKANKQSSRRRKQDRTRVAGGHGYDTRYEAPEDWPLEVAREESRQEIWEEPQSSRTVAEPVSLKLSHI